MVRNGSRKSFRTNPIFMHDKKLDGMIAQMEAYLECWKQFSNFINLARAKKFGPEEESQFLEVKSVITQQLEMILAAFEVPPVSREDIHSLVGNSASIRAMSELNENALRGLENQWHKIFISLQAVLGQLKVQQKNLEGQSSWSKLFGKKK
jgi:hypothetical protein